MAAALLLAFRRGIGGQSWIVLIGGLSAGIGITVFCLAPWVPVAMFAMALTGFGVIAQGATVNMMLQSMVDEDKRGRVMAIYTAMFIGAVPLGSFVLGWLGERIGTTHTMLWGAAACVIGAIGLFRAGAPS